MDSTLYWLGIARHTSKVVVMDYIKILEIACGVLVAKAIVKIGNTLWKN